MGLGLASSLVIVLCVGDFVAAQDPEQCRHAKGNIGNDEEVIHDADMNVDNDGDVYRGECKDGLYHGFGRLAYPDGGIYDGVWREGARHGHGVMKYPKDDDEGRYEYVGEWRRDMEWGYGELQYREVNPYNQRWTKGMFRNGLPNGNVTVSWNTGDLYQGEAVNDTKQGFGMHNFSNGDVNIGEFVEDNKHGNGTFTWVDGDVYQGEFEHDWRTGIGMYNFSDGNVYNGELFQGQMQGVGTFYWNDGLSLIHI